VALVTKEARADETRRLEQLEQEARDLGHAEGYADGEQLGRAAGYQEGFRVGSADALEAIRAEHDAVMQALAADFAEGLAGRKEEFEATLRQAFRQAESDMTDLALEIVRRILQTELRTSRDSALAIVMEALRHVTHSTEARIRVNTHDLPALESNVERLRTACASLRGIEFVNDPSIQAGCIVETAGGVIDARVEHALELFQAELKGAA
jgi:flagellar assembly protein FliH